MEKMIIGRHNAITGTQYLKDIPTTITFLTSSDDLTRIDDAEPGDMAATFGMENIYQWDGTQWVTVIEESDDE